MTFFRLDGYTHTDGRSTDQWNNGPIIGGESEERRQARLVEHAIEAVFGAEVARSTRPDVRARLDSRDDEPNPAAARAAMIKRNNDAWKTPAPAGSPPDARSNVRLDAQDLSSGATCAWTRRI